MMVLLLLIAGGAIVVVAIGATIAYCLCCGACGAGKGAKQRRVSALSAIPDDANGAAAMSGLEDGKFSNHNPHLGTDSKVGPQGGVVTVSNPVRGQGGDSKAKAQELAYYRRSK